MNLPHSRGVIGDALFQCLRLERDPAELADFVEARLVLVDDVIADDDLQLALYVLQELHYSGFDDVADGAEWDPGLIRARRMIEDRFEEELRRAVPAVPLPEPADDREGLADRVARALFALTAPGPGPSVARFVAKKATEEQVRELLMHRSLYQLKESDPHTWAIPRLSGRAKAALVEIQTDEYGNGRPERMHSALFARTLRGLGLDDGVGQYLDRLPAITIASLTMMSMFGLQRRLRGATAGHLAAFEMTSSIPSRLMGDGFRRLGFGDDVTLYFDEHVEADAVHEQIAGRDLAGGLAEAEPQLVPDILVGAAACLHLDELGAEHLLSSWQAGRSSLREAGPVLAATSALAAQDG